MGNTINAKIKYLIDKMGKSPEQFAFELGISPSIVEGILNRSIKPTSDVLQYILRRYPALSAEWLMRGKGNILLQTNKQ